MGEIKRNLRRWKDSPRNTSFCVLRFLSRSQSLPSTGLVNMKSVLSPGKARHGEGGPRRTLPRLSLLWRLLLFVLAIVAVLVSKTRAACLLRHQIHKVAGSL